jgi:hypothetical protein
MTSDARQLVNSWLSKINPADAGLVLDEHGQCRLAPSDGVMATVFVPGASSKVFYCYADLWQLPEKTAPEQLEALLAMNLLALETMGGTLGVDRQLRSLVYFYSREIAHTDLGLFCTIVDNFLQASVDVKRHIAQIFRAPAAAPRMFSPTSRKLSR